MHWAALVFGVVPVCMALGAAPFALWNRRQAMRSPGAFACKVREIGPLLPESRPTRRFSPLMLAGRGTAVTVRSGRLRSSAPAPARAGMRFPRLSSTAWWVSDVLAVQGGLGLTQSHLLPVAAGDSIRTVPDGGVRGLGDAPRSVLLILTDGRLVEVAVAGDDARLLAGPLVARVPAPRN